MLVKKCIKYFKIAVIFLVFVVLKINNCHFFIILCNGVNILRARKICFIIILEEAVSEVVVVVLNSK